MAPWRWHESRETRDEGERRKVDGRGSDNIITLPPQVGATLPLQRQ